MIWLSSQRYRVFFALTVLLSLPAVARQAHETAACFAETGSASWTDRLLVAVGVRSCLLHRN